MNQNSWNESQVTPRSNEESRKALGKILDHMQSTPFLALFYLQLTHI